MGVGMKAPRLAKLYDVSGQGVVEFALVLPVLVMLALGIFDYSRMIQASNIISNMSREGASLASRTSIAPQEIMNAIASTAQPLSMGTNGAMYITQVTQVNGVPTVQEPQSVWRGSALNSQVTQSTLEAQLGSMRIPEGDSAYIFEVVYIYNFLFIPSYAPRLQSISIL
jgi:Flp pilus assembly protein TadG